MDGIAPFTTAGTAAVSPGAPIDLAGTVEGHAYIGQR